jgi:beta-N-acetylhexosaminidase
MLPIIFGLSGARLTPEERAFFAGAEPAGFILFGRNCIAPDQLRALTDELRDLTGRADLPILVDQEGGRVARLGPPAWPEQPAGRSSTGSTAAPR